MTADPSRAVSRPVTRRLDLGRLVVVPLAVLVLVLDGDSLITARTSAPAAAVVSTALACAFYLVVIWCYLRRHPASATSRSVPASVVAVVATVLPFAIPLVRGAAGVPWLTVIADLLLIGGVGWSIWAVRWLGRNLSVLAQVRGLADSGPYRLVRHPLYAGEIVSALGLTLIAGSAAALALWLGLCAMQAYRARAEEKLLLATLPGYRGYRMRTAALLPGVF
jgi:protein-S-isoprenylcysteine O-methyltransferase Ste14